MYRVTADLPKFWKTGERESMGVFSKGVELPTAVRRNQRMVHKRRSRRRSYLDNGGAGDQKNHKMI